MTTANKYVLTLSLLSIKLAELNDREARALTTRKQAAFAHKRIRTDRRELEAAITLLKRKGAPKAAQSVAEPEQPWGLAEPVPIPPMGRPGLRHGSRVIINARTSHVHGKPGYVEERVEGAENRYWVNLTGGRGRMQFNAEELEARP
jgi:hypothetical protein